MKFITQILKYNSEIVFQDRYPYGVFQYSILPELKRFVIFVSIIYNFMERLSLVFVQYIYHI